MKIQSKYKRLVVLIFLFFIFLSGFNQAIQAQSLEDINRRGINTRLADEIKSTLKAKESRWSLIREVELSSGIGLGFKLNKKKVIVEIYEFKTVKEAVKFFAFTTNPNSIAVNVPLKPDKNFADEAMLRVTNLTGGSMINYVFRQGIYTVSIWSEEKDARRFAVHILAAIKNR